VSRRGWITFAAVSVVWGMPYLFIKIAVDEVSPVFLSFVRVALAAAVLLPLAWRSGALRGLGVAMAGHRRLRAAGDRHPVPAHRVRRGARVVVVRGDPHLGPAADDRRAGDPLRPGGACGRLAAGRPARRPVRVVVLLGLDVAGNADELVGALCILLATVGYAGGPLIIKRHLSAFDPIGTVTVAMGLAAVALAPAALLSAPSEVPSGDVLGSLAVLGVVCTALAFVLYFTLITEVGPSRAAVITYVNPVVAVALGVAVLGEPVTATAIAGLLLILAGSWLSTGGRPPGGLVAVGGRWRSRRSRRAAGTTSPTASVAGSP
jgi:drug/metabolite transporter (DMT)-like permease